MKTTAYNSESRRQVPGAALMLPALLVFGCSPTESIESEAKPESPKWPEAATPELAAGREVWIEHCDTCHGPGKVGAPKFGDAAKWAPRVTKGRDVLLVSALEGFEGKAGYEMPARGGNKDLSDGEVTSAVDYLLNYGTQAKETE